MLEYSEIIRKLHDAQDSMEEMVSLLDKDSTLSNYAEEILRRMSCLKYCIEDLEAWEDPDSEEEDIATPKRKTVHLIFRDDKLSECYSPEVIFVYKNEEKADRVVESLQGDESECLAGYYRISFEVN